MLVRVSLIISISMLTTAGRRSTHAHAKVGSEALDLGCDRLFFFLSEGLFKFFYI